jgi:hypothetical protein
MGGGDEIYRKKKVRQAVEARKRMEELSNWCNYALY